MLPRAELSTRGLLGSIEVGPLTQEFLHEPVLLGEVVACLEPRAGKQMVDGTLGGGGHARALLEAGARVLGVDRDPRALAATRVQLGERPGFQTVEGNFAQMRSLAPELFPLDGILVDLGVSSPQLDEAQRGFSFQRDGPLDMRMGGDGETAAELIGRLTDHELADVIHALGEEPHARPIARELKRTGPATTREAAQAVERAVPRSRWPTRIHVATRTFQALRMAVNEELPSLDRLLEQLPDLLHVGGRAAIISFHSLEDRRVKEAFRVLEGRCTCPPGLPICACGAKGAFRSLQRKAITASDEEVARNPRARSARLRAVEKVR